MSTPVQNEIIKTKEESQARLILRVYQLHFKYFQGIRGEQWIDILCHI